MKILNIKGIWYAFNKETYRCGVTIEGAIDQLVEYMYANPR